MDEALFTKHLEQFCPETIVSNEDITEQETCDNLYNSIELGIVNEDGKNVDLAKANYLNLLNNKAIQKIGEKAIRKYGVGTCNPQFFYGTTDLHEQLERKLANFLGKENLLIYSYGYMTLCSTLIAFGGDNDIIFADDQVNPAIKHGLGLSRSKIVLFEQNNSVQFEKQVTKSMSMTKKRDFRMFLILEGLSWSTGKLCRLKDFVEICEKYKIRIFLDESYTIGLFGANGKGLLEHYNIEASRIDLIFGTFENAFGSIGGFGAGSQWIILQLKMRGAGWLFSAALPTYLCAVVFSGIDLITENNLPNQFQKFAVQMHNFFQCDCNFNVLSDKLSPFKLIKVKQHRKCYEFCKENGVHFILRNDLLLINLNVNLLVEKKQFAMMCDVFLQASKLFN